MKESKIHMFLEKCQFEALVLFIQSKKNPETMKIIYFLLFCVSDYDSTMKWGRLLDVRIF